MAGWTEGELELLRMRIAAWFQENARDLPWRHSHDPYRIWVSEVMLQQTRVATVIERYTQFVRRFPSLVSLALAGEDEVLALWSGLGYYKRARLLRESARLLIREHGGSLPKSSAELRRLPGVGDYTAAAIASIAYGEPTPVLDGNVERVLIRLLEIDGASRRWPAARLRQAAGKLLDPASPGLFNQAMMELGATVCLPKHPLCQTCPVEDLCGTRGEHVAPPRRQMLSRRVSYALIRKAIEAERGRAAVLLVRRPADAGQMPGMWELPVLPSESQDGRPPVLRVRHSITNTNYYVEVFESEPRERGLPHGRPDEKWFSDSELEEAPLTGLARKILMRLDVFGRPRHVRRKRVSPATEEGLPLS